VEHSPPYQRIGQGLRLGTPSLSQCQRI